MTDVGIDSALEARHERAIGVRTVRHSAITGYDPPAARLRRWWAGGTGGWLPSVIPLRPTDCVDPVDTHSRALGRHPQPVACSSDRIPRPSSGSFGRTVVRVYRAGARLCASTGTH